MGDSGSKLRSIDLKDKFSERFQDKLKFARSSYFSSSKASEYVFSADDELISVCINAATRTHGIQQAVTLKNVAKAISTEIQTKNKKVEQQWPPTPQEVMQKVSEQRNESLYNFIAWIVNPNSTYDENGIVQLSKTKATKITKICAYIASLVPNAFPSLNQFLLSLNVYRKTGSSNIVDDLHKLGHGLSYTETKFIEYKWAEWTESQGSLIPSNIRKGLWKFKLQFYHDLCYVNHFHSVNACF